MTAPIDTYLRLFSGNANPAIARALEVAKADGLLALQFVTPVDTGRLKSGWSIQTAGRGLRISNPTPYSTYVEMGTRKMRAQPMVSYALPHIQSVFRQALIKELGKQLSMRITKGLDEPFSATGYSPRDSKVYQLLTQTGASVKSKGAFKGFATRR